MFFYKWWSVFFATRVGALLCTIEKAIYNFEKIKTKSYVQLEKIKTKKIKTKKLQMKVFQFHT